MVVGVSQSDYCSISVNQCHCHVLYVYSERIAFLPVVCYEYISFLHTVCYTKDILCSRMQIKESICVECFLQPCILVIFVFCVCVLYVL